MQNKHEVLTMEQLHHLINDACNSIDIAFKTKVKLRKIIQNEEFEYGDLDGILVQANDDDGFFDLTKTVYSRWSEYFKKAVIIARNMFKIEQLKYLEQAHLMVDIESNENNSDEEKRNSLHDFLDYKFKKNMSSYTIDLLEKTDVMEFIEAQFLFDYNENREYTTIEGYLNGYGDRLFSFTENFCLINKVGLDVTDKLLKVAKVHYLLTIIIISNCHKRIVEGSNYIEIVDSFKSQYEEELKVKPREKGFKFYLEGVFEIHNLYLDDVLMRHLAEYVVSEKEKNTNFIKEAKNNQQTLIDITPKQTLSIETTSATVEESNKEFDFKRFAEVANGRINEYGERNEDLCKEFEEICLSEGYKEWVKTLPTTQEVIEQQDKESKESYSKITPNPSGLRSKTGTFTLGYGNDWQEEEKCMAFHYFLKNINKPLTIKQIQANLFPRYSEFVIIRLLDELVERFEIEYTKEKIDNEDVYKIEPLEMFLWNTKNTHFLSKKMRRESIIEIVERVRTNVYDRHYQEVKKEIELDVLVNFLNPIDEIKERIETVRGKLEKRITSY